jgi:hypothetical protein
MNKYAYKYTYICICDSLIVDEFGKLLLRTADHPENTVPPFLYISSVTAAAIS